MAITGPTIWEVRTTGNAANGGGYDAALGGVDYSQQNAAQVAYTDLVIDATTNTKCTSAATPFTSNHIGNIINITGGTGFTVQRVQVVSVAAAVATCDKSLGTLSSTGGTGNLGGALINPVDADAVYAPGNVIYVESGSYAAHTSTKTFTADGSVGVGNISYIGYPSGGSRTDQDITEASMPVFTSATNSVAIFTTNNANFLRFRNFKITHTAGTRGVGFANATAGTVNGPMLINCVFDGCLWAADYGTGGGATAAQHLLWQSCTIRNGTAGGLRVNGSNTCVFIDSCYITACAGPGISFGTTTVGLVFQATNCVIAGQTGASGHGLYCICTTATTQTYHVRLIGNSIYNNAQHGIRFDLTTSRPSTLVVSNNVIVSNAARGISCATAGIIDGSQAVVRCNAFYNNSSGDRQNFATGEGDVTLSGNPFTNAGSADYSLDNTASEGAACRSAAWSARIGALGATAGTNYMDIGALQAQATAGGGTVAYGFAG